MRLRVHGGRWLAALCAGCSVAACVAEDRVDLQPRDGSAPGGASGAGTGGWGAGGTGGQPSPPRRCDINPGACAQPPPPPAAPAARGTRETVFAVRKLFLGGTDRAGVPSTSAWKQYGFNLDWLSSKKTDSNHCQPVAGTYPATVKTDGEGGIDNSFGANLLPLGASLEPRLQDRVNRELEAGRYTLLFRLTNLEDPAWAQTGVNALVYRGADLGRAPAWDGTDPWPVTADSVAGGDLGRPLAAFPESYVTGSTWVVVGVPLELRIDGGAMDPDGGALEDRRMPWTLPLAQVAITMELEGTGTELRAARGVIGGFVETERLVEAMRRPLEEFDPALCEPETMASLVELLRSASDIMADGTNGDPTKTCDAISVGLGFEAGVVRLGEVAPPEPRSDPCLGGGG